MPAGSFGLDCGGRYSDTVERYRGGYAGASFHCDSSSFVEAIAVSRDFSEDEDEDMEALSSMSSSFSTSGATGADPNSCEPNPKAGAAPVDPN